MTVLRIFFTSIFLRYNMRYIVFVYSIFVTQSYSSGFDDAIEFPHSDSDDTVDTCTNNTVPAGCCPICNQPIQPDDVTATFSGQNVAVHSNCYIRNGPPRRTAEPSTPHISRGLRRITSINSIET